MAISITNLSATSPAASTSNNVSITRTSGRVYAVTVSSLTNTSTNPSTPTVSGTGLTTLGSETNLYTGSGTNRRRVTVIFMLATSSGTNNFTIAHGTAPTRMSIVIDEISGGDTTTPYNTSNVQTVASTSSTNTLTEAITMTNSPTIPANNRIFSVFSGNVNSATVRSENDADKGGTTNSTDWTDLGTVGNSSAPVHRTLTFWNSEAVRRDLTPGFIDPNNGFTYGQIGFELNIAASGDATATPSAIALTVTTPAPTASGSSNTSPSAISRTVTTPAPTTTGEANTSPTAVSRTVTLPAPTATGGGGDGTATPAAIVATSTIPGAPTLGELVTEDFDGGASGDDVSTSNTSASSVSGAGVAKLDNTHSVTGANSMMLQASSTTLDTDGRGATWTFGSPVNDVYVSFYIYRDNPAPDGYRHVSVGLGPTINSFVYELGGALYAADPASGTQLGPASVSTSAFYRVDYEIHVTGTGTGTHTLRVYDASGSSVYSGTGSYTRNSMPSVTVGYTGASAATGSIWKVWYDRLRVSAVAMPSAPGADLSVTGGATTTPSAVGLAAVLPAPTADGGGGAGNASPSAISLSVSVPAPTATGGANTTTTAITVATTHPSPTVTGGATTTPTAITATATLPGPTAAGGAATTPSAISRAVTVPAPTTTGGAATSPAAISRTVTLPAPTTTGGGTTSPSAVNLTVTATTPTATGGAATSPAAVNLAITATTPTATGGANTSPSAVALTVTAPAPSVSSGSSANPSAVALTVNVPAPTVTAGANTTPTAIAVNVTTPAPSAKGGAATSPAAIPLTISAPSPTVTGGAATYPNAVAFTVSIPAPTVTGGGSASPSAIAVVTIIPTPTVDGGTILVVVIERIDGWREPALPAYSEPEAAGGREPRAVHGVEPVTATYRETKASLA